MVVKIKEQVFNTTMKPINQNKMKLFKSKWGKWSDISVGSCCGIKYVLQARRRENGKIQMRVERLMGAYDTVAHPTLEQLELVTFKSE